MALHDAAAPRALHKSQRRGRSVCRVAFAMLCLLWEWCWGGCFGSIFLARVWPVGMQLEQAASASFPVLPYPGECRRGKKGRRPQGVSTHSHMYHVVCKNLIKPQRRLKEGT